MALPDVKQLLGDLAEQIRPALTPDTALVGIHTGGVWLAERLHTVLGISPPLGSLDVAFYRDDYGKRGLHPRPQKSGIPFDVTDRHIILVDDVLYTGRTTRAVINELFDFGRPASVTLAVLVDRGGRQLPIQPAFTAAHVEVPPQQQLALARDESGKFYFAMKEAR